MNTITNFKKILYLAIGLLIVIAAIFGIFQLNKPSQEELDLSPKELQSLDAERKEQVLRAQLKDLEEQEKSLTENASASDKYVLYIQMAEVKTAVGDHQGALDALNKIANDNQGNTRIWTTYAQIYKNIGDTSKAKESIQKALDLDNEISATWNLWLELNQDLPNDQLNARYREAIALTKSNVDIMVSYAKFNERIGDKATAIAAWETAINVNPDKSADYQKEIDRLKQ